MFNENLSPALQASISRTVAQINENPGCKAAAVKGHIPLQQKSLVLVMMTPEIYEQFKNMMEQQHITFHAYM